MNLNNNSNNRKCMVTGNISTDAPGEINTLRPRQNGRYFPDDISKWIFLNENVWISIKISLKFVPSGPINNIPSLVRIINNIPGLIQIMAWRLPGNKPLSEPMMVSLLTHICVTRPQWVRNNDCVQYSLDGRHFSIVPTKMTDNTATRPYLQ